MITWTIKQFNDLVPHELYAILRLRTEVFVVEQACVFQDMDNKDQVSWHLMGYAPLPGAKPAIEEPGSLPASPVSVTEQGSDPGMGLVAYTRLVPPGVSYAYPSIGRVVTAPAVRGSGMGKLLMEKSIRELRGLFGDSPIRIGAQLYLKKFYEAFGFEQSSIIYDEDGIDHIEMTRL